MAAAALRPTGLARLNPLTHVWASYCEYLERIGHGLYEVFVFGMNPGLRGQGCRGHRSAISTSARNCAVSEKRRPKPPCRVLQLLRSILGSGSADLDLV